MLPWPLADVMGRCSRADPGADVTAADGVAERFAEVRALVRRQPRDLHPLRRVCLAAAGALSASGAGINVMTEDGTRGVCVASDTGSERIEELQFVFGEGPCIDAFAERRPVLTADLSDTAADRWPVYAPAAREGGVRALFAFPLQVGGARLGVMDIFRDRVGHLTGDELGTAFTFADVTVETLLDGEDNRSGAADLFDAGQRAVVFQAQGMVMVQLGVSIGEALVRMRAFAFAEDRRLEDVARDVVDRRLRFDRSDG
jgi:GAF domain/ANTAR domain